MGGEHEKEGGGEHWSPWANFPGMPHGVTEFAEGFEAIPEATAHAAAHAAKLMAPGPGGYAPALVAPEIARDAAGFAPATLRSTWQAAQAGAAESSGLPMVSKGLAPLALAAGLFDMWGAGKSMKKEGANLENTPEMVKGGLEATAGGIGTAGLVGSLLTSLGFAGAGGAIGGAAAAAAPVGMVAGAGAAGMAIGDLMAHAADSDKTKDGTWGKDESGKNKSAMDWGAGWGTWVDTHIGDKNAAHPSVLGGIAAGAGGIVSGALGTAQWGGNTTVGIGKSIGNWAKHLF